MIKLLNGTDLTKYKPREYIIADNDTMSEKKIIDFESNLGAKSEKSYTIHKLYRSRKVGQSYVTSVFTTIIAILYSIPLMFRIKPRLLLVNGPGTCVPCCLIVFIFSKIMCLMPKCQICFTESICRVKTLSLTGKILYHLKVADLIFVQWSELQKKYPNSIYLGRLV